MSLIPVGIAARGPVRADLASEVEVDAMMAMGGPGGPLAYPARTGGSRGLGVLACPHQRFGMRRTIGLRKLRSDLTNILRRVSEEGEVVDVTKHGRAIARIVPVLADTELSAPSGSAWAEMDRLAAEIGRHWNPESMSGPDGVSADRRG